jgi:hypothetical protein
LPIRMSRDWRMKRRTIRHPSFDDDEHIVIKSYYGDHDRQRVLSAATEYIRDETTGQTRILATLDKMHAVKREIAVVSWNLKDEDRFPLPFSQEVLLNLPVDIATWLDEEINRDWNSLGEPLSKSEAEAKEQQAKEDRTTFQRHSLGLAIEPGAASNGRADDGARAGDPGRRDAETASAEIDEGVSRPVLGTE